MKSMKRVILPLLVLLLLTGCAAREPEPTPEPTAAAYTQIDQETARRMMARDDGHVVVDVRRQDEYDEGHIPARSSCRTNPSAAIRRRPCPTMIRSF